MHDKAFLDTNLWVYLKAENQLPTDIHKQKVVQTLILSLPEIVVSTQILNELANVLMKKFSFSETSVGSFIAEICNEFEVINLTPQITQKALILKANYSFSWFDSLIVASSLLSNCTTLYTEDMQDGLLIDKSLKVINPF